MDEEKKEAEASQLKEVIDILTSANLID